MLLIIELLFLFVGLWALVLGRLPAGVFRVLFGKGHYAFSPLQARLLGLFLITPLPVSLLVSVVLTFVLGGQAVLFAVGFELAYLVFVAITTMVIARRVRAAEVVPAQPSAAVESPTPQKRGSYGVRLLAVTGIAILTCLVAVSLGSLILVLGSIAAVGIHWTGDFWQDVFPFILLLLVIGLGSFGIFRLVRVLRR